MAAVGLRALSGSVSDMSDEQGQPPKSRDAERTRAELLEVATEVFSESGYSGARVDEIARRTSTTKRMIYYYFGGKEQLYVAVLENAYLGIRAVEQEVKVADLAPVDAVRRLAEATFEHHQAHPAFIRLVTIENIHRADFMQRSAALADLANPAVSVLADVLERGVAAGDFRDDVEPLDVHQAISAFCVFPVANQYTFGFLFGRDMVGAAEAVRMRAMVGDIVVAWLTSLPAA